MEVWNIVQELIKMLSSQQKTTLLEYLQNEFENIIEEITSKEELDEFLELLNSYSNTQDGDF